MVNKKALAKSQADLSVFFTLKDFLIHLLFKPFSPYLYPILLIIKIKLLPLDGNGVWFMDEHYLIVHSWIKRSN